MSWTEKSNLNANATAFDGTFIWTRWTFADVTDLPLQKPFTWSSKIQPIKPCGINDIISMVLIYEYVWMWDISQLTVMYDEVIKWNTCFSHSWIHSLKPFKHLAHHSETLIHLILTYSKTIACSEIHINEGLKHFMRQPGIKGLTLQEFWILVIVCVDRIKNVGSFKYKHLHFYKLI